MSLAKSYCCGKLFLFFFLFFFLLLLLLLLLSLSLLLLLLLLLLDGGLKYFKEDFKGVAVIIIRCPPVIFS